MHEASLAPVAILSPPKEDTEYHHDYNKNSNTTERNVSTLDTFFNWVYKHPYLTITIFLLLIALILCLSVVLAGAGFAALVYAFAIFAPEAITILCCLIATVFTGILWLLNKAFQHFFRGNLPANNQVQNIAGVTSETTNSSQKLIIDFHIKESLLLKFRSIMEKVNNLLKNLTEMMFFNGKNQFPNVAYPPLIEKPEDINTHAEMDFTVWYYNVYYWLQKYSTALNEKINQENLDNEDKIVANEKSDNKKDETNLKTLVSEIKKLINEEALPLSLELAKVLIAAIETCCKEIASLPEDDIYSRLLTPLISTQSYLEVQVKNKEPFGPVDVKQICRSDCHSKTQDPVQRKIYDFLNKYGLFSLADTVNTVHEEIQNQKEEYDTCSEPQGFQEVPEDGVALIFTPGFNQNNRQQSSGEISISATTPNDIPDLHPDIRAQIVESLSKKEPDDPLENASGAPPSTLANTESNSQNDPLLQEYCVSGGTLSSN